MQEKKKEKKDPYSKATFCQMLLCCFMLTAVFFLKSDGMKEDYSRIMSHTLAKEDFTSLVVSLKSYIYDESVLKEVFLTERETFESITEESEKTTEEVTELSEESEEESEETTLSVGGEDIALLSVPDNCTYAPLKLTVPLLKPVSEGRYTSYFGFRENPVTGQYGFHTGLDIANKEGTPVRASLSGVVTKVGEDSRAGKYIILTHDNGLLTFYCHCSEILATENAVIRQGETVALIGSTGMSTGPHLHFEVRKNGIRFDPLPLLNAD